MATELTDLDLGEWSICIDPANEDSTIEIVKSKAGLHVPVLKETDMSENTDQIDDGAEDEALEQFAAEVLEDFDGLSPEEQAEALVGLALENAELEGAVEDATEVVKALTENTVPREKFEELKKSAEAAVNLIEKMKGQGHVTAEEGGLAAEIRKSLGGAELSPEAQARLEAVEKSLAENDRKEAIAKAKTWGFGKAEDVADLHTRIKKALGQKDADAFEGIVKQAGQLAKSSPLLKSIGEDAGNVDASSPIAKANSAVAEIRKANPQLTEAQAKAQYWANNPDEYAAYQAQRASAA